jgi:methionine-S-sulfoxide reductase
MNNIDSQKIYLAGGCFWGMQAFFKRVEGVLETAVGYANGEIENPTYQQVCSDSTGFVETLYIRYDKELVCLNILLDYFFHVIDPTSTNKQGDDEGSQYRSGIYYCEAEDLELIQNYLEDVQHTYEKPIVTEILPLKNFYLAEDYHQDYLAKNPDGYCHIDLSILSF